MLFRSITPRPISIAASDTSRVYGDANPALGYTIGGMGLVNGDALTGALATSADARTSVGNYAIGQGTLAASANYSVTGFTGGTLTITPAPNTPPVAPVTSRVRREARRSGDHFRRFSFDHVVVSRLGNIPVACFEALMNLALANLPGSGRHLAVETRIAHTRCQLKGMAEQVITQQYRGLMPPAGMDGGDMSPNVGIVKNIVVHQ